MLDGSAKPREHNKHVLACCRPEDEQAVFKWSTQTGVRWLSQLSDEAGTHLRKETLSRMTSNTSALHAAAGHDTTRALSMILEGHVQTDPKTQGSKLNKPLGPWNELVHHRGSEWSFVEFSEPGEEPRLIEVCSSQEDPDSRGSLIRGWEIRIDHRGRRTTHPQARGHREAVGRPKDSLCRGCARPPPARPPGGGHQKETQRR